MPREAFGPEHAFLPHRELLSFEEIERLARLFVELGVRKIRLTGGEPLLRRGLPELIRRLAPLGVDLALTTNGSLLADQAVPLARAGLRRVTVSLDSLDDEVFRRMNDVGFSVERVLAGISAAERAGLAPIKINAVVRRGFNEDSVVALAAHFRGSGHVVRYIEYMDVGATNSWRLDEVVPAREIVAAISERWPLEPVEPDYRGEVARRWRYRDGAGEIGVVASVTAPFCGDCTRARLSADGRLFTCLFATVGTDFKRPLRRGAGDAELRSLLDRVWRARGDRYSELRAGGGRREGRVEMSFIGG